MITAEVIAVEEEAATNDLIVYVSFTRQDGTEIVFLKSGVPQIKNGRNVYDIRTRTQVLVGKNQAQINAWLLSKIDAELTRHVTNEARSGVNESILPLLSNTIGQTRTQDTAVYQVDVNNDGTNDVTITVHDDGTWSSEPI